MAIEFRCPQGHKLSCPDELAGRSAKCPKCGAMVRIPATTNGPSANDAAPVASDSAADHSELHAMAAHDSVAHDSAAHAASGSGLRSGSGVGSASGLDVAVGSGSGIERDSSINSGSGIQRENPAEVHEPANNAPAKSPASKEPTIVFLCPNGHKLNCPASMQGRPGKCPHCGAKFIIPKEDEGDDSEAGEDEMFNEMLGDADEQAAACGAGESSATVMPPPLGNVSDTADGGGDLPFDFADLVPADAGGTSANAAAMAQLVARLWQHRGEQGVLEIHLRGGEKITPDWFSARFSQDGCGMFAVQDKDGRYTLTAVNWDAVERIAVRGVDELPEGMFE